MVVQQSRGDAVDRVVDTVWRMESPRLIAALTRVTRDVGLAEDLAQDALVAALQQWPASGIPDNPAAWLTAVAKRRAVDHVRRAVLAERKHDELGHEQEAAAPTEADIDAAIDASSIEDDLLRLIFICCHPVLSVDARVTLTLRLLGGLRVDEIARAFLTSEPTIQQRIVRAKRTLAEAHVPFEVPTGADFHDRLEAVLQVVYLIFNEGYAATAGEGWVRPALCEDALRMGRVLATLVPSEPEVHGLVGLMEIQASRIRARTDPAGRPIPLLEQQRGRWDRLLIGRGLAALERAEALAEATGGSSGPYALQAAIAACHARARTPDETDWPRIVALYDALAQLRPSPVVELNRAVAVGMAYGPAAGLEIVDALRDDPTLAGYHLLPAVRGDLLAKLDRNEEAAEQLARAASMTRNVPERTLLLERAAEATRRSVG
ncbi:MAG TPA: RNA polymerase sigma factor [Candidatus Limnocylindrales bacterium]|nr:RNA polymerase sigma factor [Candidatus Limnocylindrales bacterium]